MKEVTESNGLKTLGTSKYFDNSAQFIKMWNEMAANGIQDENDLNNLRLSNLTRLGMLKKEQEEQVLLAAKEANKKLIKQRAELMRKQAEEEAETRLAQLKAAEDELTEERLAAIQRQVEEEKQIKLDNIDELVEYEFKAREKELENELKEAKKRKKKELQDENKAKLKSAFGKQEEGTTITEDWKNRKEAFKELFTGGKKINKDGTEEDAGKLAGFAYLASNLTNALSDFAKQLETQMDEIASKKSAIDTRLQGSTANGKRFGSYWDKMTADITGFAGVSPLVKQSTIASRVSEMVGQGIAFNVEQRATLDVIKDKIATTFDAANGTLLRLVRIQQQDTTAGRLGMESALTAFLNNMYETTEYMTSLARTVKGSLEEAMSLMTGENALSFEYQIQKWLGSLSSVGMSDSAVQGLAGILGQVAAGKLEGITNGGQGNLVIMSANKAGLNISDLLNDGLDQNTTNILMNEMVDYLAKLYEESKSSKVIQQQIANVYGLSASDLKAAVNLSRSSNIIVRDGLDYDLAMNRLTSMASSMGSRTSIGELMTNMWDNVKYSLSAGMVNNPITYALYKASGLLKDTTGGINFGIPLVMGNGMPIEFNVADLMRVGALAGGALSSMGRMLLGSGGGLTGKSILRGIGLTGNGISLVRRGEGTGLSTAGGMTVSESGSMVGNANSDDITSKTMTDQTDSAKSETASAVDDSDETKLSDVDSHILTIIDILRNISDGNSILRVAVEGEVKVTDRPGWSS